MPRGTRVSILLIFGRTIEGHFGGWDESTDFEESFNTVWVEYKIGIN